MQTNTEYMKSARILFPLLLITLLACRKNSGLENAVIGDSNDSAGVFSASIDGQPWIASTKFATIMNGAINISGTDGHNNTLALSLADTIVGSYPVGLQTPSLAWYTDSAMYMQEYTSNHDLRANAQPGGKVTVTAIDRINKTITGNFSLQLYNDSARNTKSVTQGNFKNLPYVTELPLAKSTDSFYVQIDGTNWTAKSISAGLVAGQMLVKGSEQDASRSVEIYMPQYVAPGWTTAINPFYLWGVYMNGNRPYSSLKYTPLENGIIEEQPYPGSFTMIEDNVATHRLRANFQFRAVTLNGSDSVQLNNGYFSVQY